MNFKQIEILGFKSFADKTQIKFEGGVTAIVGPNGCGKSNVADSVRWVLGEQSSKMLRGSSMQDVIFNGTTKRKSLSYCEVTLVFNNESRYFNMDCDEVAITRKLYRSGDSAYIINKMPCRLKDITNLLYDSGIGKNGYSIIGQGKVEEIISSKPENRRTIFEDAAGIAKFKARKKNAEDSLEKTEDNLQRANDILFELERQMGPLKKQAENAKLWLEFRDKLQDLEVNVYVYKYDTANEVKGKINAKLSGIEEELAQNQISLQEASEKYSADTIEIEGIDAKIAQYHQSILTLTVEIEKQSGHINVIRERVANLNQNKLKIQHDLFNARNALEKDSANLNFKQNDFENVCKSLECLQNSYDEISDEYLQIVDQLGIHEDQAQSGQKDIIDVLDKLTNIKANFSKYEAQRDLLSANLKETKQKIAEMTVMLNEREEQKTNAAQEVSQIVEEKKDAEQKLAKAKQNQDFLATKIKDSQELRYSINSQLQVYADRQEMLVEMQKEFDGFQYAVKKLLQECERDGVFKNKIVGVLANLLKVPEKFETAVEIALGASVQNIVTTTEEDAKYLINFLKQRAFGRATFLPINKIERRETRKEDLSFVNQNGCFGFANTLIDYNKNIANIVSSLLGNTIIVENLDVAIKMSKQSRYFKFVTLDGDVINPQGSMTGGSKKKESSNLISREREIKTLGENIESFNAKLQKLNEELQTASKDYEQGKFELNQLFERKNNAEINYAKEGEKLASIESAYFSLKDELFVLNQQENSLTIKIDVITSELESINQLEKSSTQNREEADKILKERNDKFAALREKKDFVSDSLTKVKVELATANSQKGVLEQEIARLKEEISINKDAATAFDRELKNVEATIFEADKMIEAEIESTSSEQSKQELATLNGQMATQNSRKSILQEEIKVLDQEKMRIVEYISKLNDRKNNSLNQLEKVDTDIEQMQERIFEEYSLTYSGCLPFVRADFEVDSAMVEIASIKKDINKLGYVNVHAIEEVKLLMERYEGLKKQTDDLEQAQENLNKVIKELSLEMTTRFETEFNKINTNFAQTFKELFGGGNAKLILTDPSNVLESGVDIIAEPPGKKMNSLMALSGGEKALTAIAILFAILKLKPMPFCLLDEIEAALDDSNVGRFAEYLKKFSKVTQFIVITHRKPTMELADSLFGVTMEEKGVSKMISVQLSDAIKNIEEDNNGSV